MTATVKVHFVAWSYVHRLLSNNNLGNDECSNVVDNFAKNWSSTEFEELVDELAELVDRIGDWIFAEDGEELSMW